MEERIKVSNLAKRFGTFTAVHDVSFTVHENEFFSLLLGAFRMREDHDAAVHLRARATH